jgi:hypothetical protein
MVYRVQGTICGHSWMTKKITSIQTMIKEKSSKSTNMKSACFNKAMNDLKSKSLLVNGGKGTKQTLSIQTMDKEKSAEKQPT